MDRRAFLSALAAATLSATCRGCPDPVPGGGPSVTPGSWTDTARTVLATLGWAIPAARAILATIVPEPARSVVLRALDALSDAAGRLGSAVDAYQSRGGDQCPAYAAVGGVHSAIVSLARVLADAGVALGTTLAQVADSVGSIADVLTPRCQPDAGWSSAGDRINVELDAIQYGAAARGRILRRDLDNLQPPR